MAKTYAQYCPVAAALDHVGDRWTMLILRDLVWYGPARFTDLAAHNDGVPPALLSQRLRTLVAAGVATRVDGEYRVDDPDGSIRALIDGLATFGLTMLVATDPTPKSLEYLARRVTSVRHEELQGVDLMQCNLVIGGTEVGVSIGDGAVEITNPFDNAPVVATTAAEFARFVMGHVSVGDLAISDDRARITAGLSLVSLAA